MPSVAPGPLPRAAAPSVRRRGWLVALALALLTCVAWATFWRRPILDDEERAEAEAIATRAVTASATDPCPRPVVRGIATPGDGSERLRALLSLTGAFAGCIDHVRAEREALHAALVLGAAPESGMELPEGDETRDLVEDPPSPPAGAGWDYVAMGRLLHDPPPPVEAAVLAACPGLDLEVEAIARHTSVCSPFNLSRNVIFETGGVTGHGAVRAIALADAIAVHARARATAGDPGAALELLLDGLAILVDLARGHPSLVGAMVAIAALDRLVAQFRTLMASELALTDGELARTQEQLVALTRALPDPTVWLAEDSVGIALGPLHESGWAPPEGIPVAIDPELALGRGVASIPVEESVIAAMLEVQRHLDGLCSGAATQEACREALAEEQSRARADSAYAAEWGATLAIVLGPRAGRDALIRAGYSTLLDSLVTYAVRALRSYARLRALHVLVEHRRMAGAGDCPDAAELRTHLTGVPTELGLGGHFSVYDAALPYAPIDISAPLWLGDPSWGVVRLSLLEAYCPIFPLVGVDPTSPDPTQVPSPP